MRVLYVWPFIFDESWCWFPVTGYWIINYPAPSNQYL